MLYRKTLNSSFYSDPLLVLFKMSLACNLPHQLLQDWNFPCLGLSSIAHTVLSTPIMENHCKQAGGTISCWQIDNTLPRDGGWAMELWHRSAIDWAQVNWLLDISLPCLSLKTNTWKTIMWIGYQSFTSEEKSNVCFHNRFICYFASIWSCFMMYVGISWDGNCNTNMTDQENCSSKRETRKKNWCT